MTSNGGSAAQFGHGVWTFTDVAIRQNKGLAIYLQDGKLVMRGCTVKNNGGGIDIFDNGSADLGTIVSPGNNVIQANGGAGFSIDGNFGAKLVEAVGNIWNPDVQGANAEGRYSTAATIPGPVPSVNGNNYMIASGWSLTR